ncbi:MAG: leucine-rich repeat domain-containing protein [Christensenellales bacterium]
MYCGKCGFKNAEEMDYCGKCGSPLYKDVSAPCTAGNEENAGKSNGPEMDKTAAADRMKISNMPWFFIVLISLIILFGSAALLFFKDLIISKFGMLVAQHNIPVILIAALVAGILGIIGVSLKRLWVSLAASLTLTSGYILLALGIITFIYELYEIKRLFYVVTFLVFGFIQTAISIHILTKNSKTYRRGRTGGGVKRRLTMLTVILLCIAMSAPFMIAGLESLGAKDVVVIENEELEKAIRISLWKPVGVITQENMEDIEYLYCNPGNKGYLFDIAPLKYCVNLKNITIYNSAIPKITVLSGLKKLVYVQLDDCVIVDISPLGGLSGLLGLDLRRNEISDISALAGLTNLQTLNLSGNRISDISALRGLTYLHSLGLDNNLITDIAPLSDLRGLKSLYLTNNPIKDYSPIEEYVNQLENKDF